MTAAAVPSAGASSNDTRYLSTQVSNCADCVANLIVETQRQKNFAIDQGDVTTADDLNEKAITLSVQYGILARHQLQEIDDSNLMKKTIRGFADVNAQIKQAIADVKKATDFAKALAGIAGVLQQLIGIALK